MLRGELTDMDNFAERISNFWYRSITQHSSDMIDGRHSYRCLDDA